MKLLLYAAVVCAPCAASAQKLVMPDPQAHRIRLVYLDRLYAGFVDGTEPVPSNPREPTMPRWLAVEQVEITTPSGQAIKIRRGDAPNRTVYSETHAHTRAEDWLPGLQKALADELTVNVSGNGGDFGGFVVQLSPDAAWFVASAGSDADKALVRAKFPEYVGAQESKRTIRVTVNKAGKLILEFADRETAQRIERSDVRITLPSGARVVATWGTAETRPSDWTGWRDSLDKGAQVEVENLGKFKLDFTPESAWVLANAGSTADREFVAAKFPEHPSSKQWKGTFAKEQEMFTAALGAATAANNVSALVALVAKAPTPELAATTWQRFDSALSSLNLKPAPGWVAPNTEITALEMPSDSAGTAFTVAPDTLLMQVGRLGKWLLVAQAETENFEPVPLSAIRNGVKAIGWLSTKDAKTLVDAKKRAAEMEHGAQVADAVRGTELEQGIVGIAQMEAQLGLLRRSGSYQAAGLEVKIRQAREYLCIERKKAMKQGASGQDVATFAKGVCKDAAAEAEQEGNLAVSASGCLKNITRCQ
jgi:hypothetical protein